MDISLEQYIRDAGLSTKPICFKTESIETNEEEVQEDILMLDENIEFPTCTIEEIPPEQTSQTITEQVIEENQRGRWNICEDDLQWRIDRHRMPSLVRYDEKVIQRKDLRGKIYNRNKNVGSIYKNHGFDLRNRLKGERQQHVKNPMNPMAALLSELGRQFQENKKKSSQLVPVNGSNQINGALHVIGGILQCLNPTPTLQRIDEVDVKIQSEIQQLQLQRKKTIMNKNVVITTEAADNPEIIEEGTIRSVHTTNMTMHHRFSNMTPMEVVI